MTGYFSTRTEITSYSYPRNWCPLFVGIPLPAMSREFSDPGGNNLTVICD